jgi:hypothetical protein
VNITELQKYSDFGLALEDLKILKIHFNLSSSEFQKIISQYRKDTELPDVLRLSK